MLSMQATGRLSSLLFRFVGRGRPDARCCTSSPSTSSSASAADGDKVVKPGMVQVRRAGPVITIIEDPQDVSAVIDRQLVRKEQDPEVVRGELYTLRREALALYRDVLRLARLFTWPDEQGRPWREVIETSARTEYEAARFEKDPEVVGRLLVQGRDYVEQTLDRMAEKVQADIAASEQQDPRRTEPD
eukprot:jgi/Chlat1/276/Chrsp1S03162